MSRDPEAELRSIAKSVYMVNEKNPRTFDRQWRVHVLLNTWLSQSFYGSDSEAGRRAAISDALAWAKRRQTDIEATRA